MVVLPYAVVSPCGGKLKRKQQIRDIRTNPPTTPPAMAPVWLLCEWSFGATSELVSFPFY